VLARHTKGIQSLTDLTVLLKQIERSPAILVTVVRAQGSVPRETGAWMAVWHGGQAGTIGGGHLEWDASRQCLERLSAGLEAGPTGWTQRTALGPSLGQCCGGVVELQFEHIASQDRSSLQARLNEPGAPVALFGGGHVGRAIVRALAPLPFQVRWIDSRDEVFPEALDGDVQAEHSDPVHAAVADLVAGSSVLIMSFSHAEDLDIVAACLSRLRQSRDLPFVGLIGSRTKWATFRKRLAERGFSDGEMNAVTSPIGLPGIAGKEPAVIAAAVAAQLLLLPR
jgi:xanthine dehydrogenase accessory factor